MAMEVNIKGLQKSITTVILNSGGIKINDLIVPLCHGLLTEGYEIRGDEVQNLVYRMITNNEICEIIYEINGRANSFLLPPETKVTGNAILATPYEAKKLSMPVVPTQAPLPKLGSPVTSIPEPTKLGDTGFVAPVTS